MDESEKIMLQDILVLEILRLAKEIKAERNTNSDCIKDAVMTVRKKRAEVLRILAETI